MEFYNDVLESDNIRCWPIFAPLIFNQQHPTMHNCFLPFFCRQTFYKYFSNCCIPTRIASALLTLYRSIYLSIIVLVFSSNLTCIGLLFGLSVGRPIFFFSILSIVLSPPLCYSIEEGWASTLSTNLLEVILFIVWLLFF